MSALGFIGLGAMGKPMAARLLASGHRLYATNRTPSKARALIERGARWCETPREVAAAAEVIFSMVSDDAAIKAISSGPDGLLAGLTQGKVYVDMSTVSPDASRRLAHEVRSRGANMLDAPVSGSVPQAEDGSLTIMVAGEEPAFQRVEPLLRELGKTVTYVGPNGQALVLKLAINVNLAVQMVAFSEGLLLAERGGIDRQLALEVMTNSAIGSPLLKGRAPMLLELPEHGWFDIELMRKDVRLALRAARTLDVPLRSATVADELLLRARELGYGNRDIAALFEVLASMDGTPARGRG